MPFLEVISAAYKLLLDKAAGFVPFHKDVMIVSAGNRPEESSIANLLPAPLINRVIVITVSRPTISEWVRWMDSTYEEWDRRTYAFLTNLNLRGEKSRMKKKESIASKNVETFLPSLRLSSGKDSLARATS